MFKRLAAIAATATIAVAGLAGVASANTVHDTAWTQTTDLLRCNTTVVGDPSGTMRLSVAGNEVRDQFEGFATVEVVTQLHIQKLVGGAWLPYDNGDLRTGWLGPVRPQGSGYIGLFHWSHSPVNETHPSFGAKIVSSGTYRPWMETSVYDQDGYRVAHMTSGSKGTCTFVGKK